MTMNKNSSSKRDAIDWMELRREATRFDSDRQYLVWEKSKVSNELA